MQQMLYYSCRYHYQVPCSFRRPFILCRPIDLRFPSRLKVRPGIFTTFISLLVRTFVDLALTKEGFCVVEDGYLR